MATDTVYITGASTGIGRALALELGRRGARVALAARRQDLLEEVAFAMRPARAIVVPVDVADTEAAAEGVRRAERELGSLHMVIANAGIGQAEHAGRLAMASVKRVIDVNVTGAFATLVAAIPIMLLEGHGHLVGVSSLAGRRGLPVSGAYSASKAALSTFLETLRLDLKASGITVTDVQPGFVATPLTEKADHAMPFLWSAERAAKYIVDGLERRKATVAFPPPLVALTALGRVLPAWLYDRLVGLGPVPKG